MTIISTTVGKNPLEKNGVALTVTKRVQNALLGCSLKNDRRISVHFQGKPFNIRVIQIYVPTANVEDAEQFHEELQDLLAPTEKQTNNNKKR